MNKLEIEKNLVVSTAHITADDNRMFESDSIDHSSVVVYSTDFFHLVLLDRNGVDLSMFSLAFRDLYSFAANHEEEFHYLKIDADGPILDKLPTFDW